MRRIARASLFFRIAHALANGNDQHNGDGIRFGAGGAGGKRAADTTIAFVVVDLRALKNGDFSTLGNLFGLDRLLGITFMNSGSTQPTPGIEDLIVEALYTTLTSVYTYQRDGEIVTLDSVSDWLGDYAVIALNELPEAPERNYAAIDAGLITPVPSATPSLNTPDPLYVRSNEFFAEQDANRRRQELIILVQSVDDTAAERTVTDAVDQWLTYNSGSGQIGAMQVGDDGVLYIPVGSYYYGPPIAVYGNLPGFVVGGQPRSLEAVENVRLGGRSLAETAAYEQDFTQLSGDNPLFAAWYNLNASAETLYAPFDYFDEGTDFSEEIALAQNALGDAGASARLLEGGGAAFDLTYQATFPVDLPLLNPVAEADSQPPLSSLFPEGTLFMAESTDLDMIRQFIQETAFTLADVFDNPNSDYDGRAFLESQLALAESVLGFTLEELFDNTGGNYAIGLLETTGTFRGFPFAGILMVQAQDADAAEAIHDRVLDALLIARTNPVAVTINGYSFDQIVVPDYAFSSTSSIPVTFGVADDLFLMGTGDAVEQITAQIAAAEGENLTTTDEWAAAFAHSDGFGNTLMYYDNDTTLRLLRRILTGYSRETLESIYMVMRDIDVIAAVGRISDGETASATVYVIPR